ncbi:MAG TPA: hypothetical protein PK325_03275 [Cyclobacteriaceae bacterium]|nr:hypothetical protein [Cyclobacteriaceae bacterium]HMV09901.1 hypothetical protein [Cyclobacteriaceae bacterium]HMV88727.1 hypothetical protein [Cyclobacteriaceae bacterium]HMW99639.1 hypothetical protein [Cyclobacteriaceae bacterium]HMX50984.1 hypothetical protein [Cyclobacteriaceae bacterium]
MEELDDLKQIWKSHGQGYEPKKESEIALMLQGRSNSIIGKIKRNVWFELIFTIACSIALLVYTFTLEAGAIMWTIISLLVLFTAYLFYYVKKLLLLGRFDPSGENIKSSLENLHRKLTIYVNFYRKSYTVLYPVYFFLGLFLGALDTGLDGFLNRMRDPKTVITLIGVMGLFFVLGFIATHFYLKKLYGNHLLKLKELLTELQG